MEWKRNIKILLTGPLVGFVLGEIYGIVQYAHDAARYHSLGFGIGVVLGEGMSYAIAMAMTVAIFWIPFWAVLFVSRWLRDRKERRA